jgi:uncharacterized protein
MRFSNWLNAFTATLKGESEGNVPCGECVGCCISSYFIHIKPTDTDSINHIPKELMFSAPGLPKGHYLLGYDEKGHCPMFKDGRCSIYCYRPETCRQYDCRVYPATGIFPDDDTSQIFKKAKGWKFDVSSPEDMEAFEAVQTASKFIRKYKDLFPKQFFPCNRPQQAVLAIRIHSEFIRIERDKIETNSKTIVDAIVKKYGKK